MKIGENFRIFWKQFGRNPGKASLMYLCIRERILRNFERMLRDLVFYLTFTKKTLQNCYEIFSQFLQNLLESSLLFFQSSSKFCEIIPKFVHKCSNVSLMITWTAYCWQDQPSYRSYHLQNSISIYWYYRKDSYCILLFSVMLADAAQKKLWNLVNWELRFGSFIPEGTSGRT